MKITYINHSSFSIELDNCTLLFDYFEGEIPEFDKNKKLYVFSSHGHHDHFNSVIFDLESKYKDIKYILSSDIKNIINKEANNITYIDVNEDISLDKLEIKTLESSDIGVAFIVNVEGKTIYHAGDLNWWHWEGENSDKENKEAESMFKKEIDKIKNNHFDIAFVPLDPRQGEQYYLGFDTFMKNTNTKIVFPMHCWGKYSIIKKLLESNHSNTYKDKIISINHKNQEFNIEI